MNSSINKITSFLVAFLVLFSTFSFTVDRHYCGGFLVAVSYSGETEVCKSDVNDFSVKVKGCCSDEVQTIEGQDELQIHVSKRLATKAQFIATDFIFHRILFVDEFPEHNTYKEFSPKNVPINYQVLHQSFLI
jgi:hypothetical protein